MCLHKIHPRHLKTFLPSLFTPPPPDLSLLSFSTLTSTALCHLDLNQTLLPPSGTPAYVYLLPLLCLLMTSSNKISGLLYTVAQHVHEILNSVMEMRISSCVSASDLENKCVRVKECLVHLFLTLYFLLLHCLMLSALTYLLPLSHCLYSHTSFYYKLFLFEQPATFVLRQWHSFCVPSISPIESVMLAWFCFITPCLSEQT